MSDLISRQDAKDAIDMALDHIDHVPPWVYDKLLNALNELPSAEPEIIIKCRDCKHHDGIRCFRWNSTIITGFDDYCSNAERRGEEE